MKDNKSQGSLGLNNASQNDLKEDTADNSMSTPLVLLIAVATGMTVASIYYAQPLLAAIRKTLGLSVASAGFIVTASQLGYAIGLALLVPLGDLFEHRKLVVAMTSAWRQALSAWVFPPMVSHCSCYRLWPVPCRWLRRSLLPFRPIWQGRQSGAGLLEP